MKFYTGIKCLYCRNEIWETDEWSAIFEWKPGAVISQEDAVGFIHKDCMERINNAN